MKDITNKDHVKESKDAGGSSKLLTFDKGKTPIYLASGAYMDGFVHWIKIKGHPMRLACAGGIDGKGYAPDDCPLCYIVNKVYEKAKELQSEGKEKAAETLRKKIKDFRGKYEAAFVAYKGEMLLTRNKDGKKVMVPDFEDGEVGVLSLTRKQFEDFIIKTPASEKFPFIESMADLMNRAIVLDKAKRGDSDYMTVEFIPARNKSDKPDIAYDPKEYDIDEMFVVNSDALKAAAKLVVSFIKGGSDDVEEEETKSKKSTKADRDVEFEDELVEDATSVEEDAFDGVDGDDVTADSGDFDDEFLEEDFGQEEKSEKSDKKVSDKKSKDEKTEKTKDKESKKSKKSSEEDDGMEF